MSSEQISRLEGLKKTHQSLEKKKMQCDAQVSHLTSERDALLKTMKEEFGVSTLDELRKVSADLRLSNEESLNTFAAALQDVEARLTKLNEEV